MRQLIIYEKYTLLEDGRLFTIKPCKQLTPRLKATGYGYSIRIGKEFKTIYIHQELAKAFIPNPQAYKMVRFKDGNKENYSLGNLGWGSNRYLKEGQKT